MGIRSKATVVQLRKNKAMKRTLICVVVTTAIGGWALQPQAHAQGAFARKGVVELGGSIGFSSTSQVDSEGDALTIFQVRPFFGYFVADGLEIGLNPIDINITSIGNNSLTEVLTLFSVAYNFTTEGAGYPFLEGLVGFSSLSNDESLSGLAWGGRGGVKVSIAEQALLNLALQYTRQNYENTELAILSVTAGFSVWLP